jgi:hypothetical protein
MSSWFFRPILYKKIDTQVIPDIKESVTTIYNNY